MLLNPFCPCGNPLPYADCCEPYHTGKAVAATAEALMRSRYSAYVKRKIDYLIETLHPACRQTDDRLQLAQSLKTTRWIRLEVIKTEQGRRKDKQGVVEFIASHDLPQPGQLHERSRFTREKGRWFYVDGDILPPLRLSPP